MRCPSLATAACLVAAVLCSQGCRESAKTMRTFSHGLARHDDDDDLLTRIRASLADGEIAPSLLQALMASDDPDHARARRIFEAMQGADPATAETPDPGEDDEAVALVPTPLAVVQQATGAATTPSSAPSAQPSSKSSSTSRPPTPAPTQGARPKIKSMALRPSGKGATLTLRANSGVLVGVVNQRRSGLVRLVVDASADPATLRARPSVKGAKVTTVRRVGDSIFVTLQLDPGWALGRITKTSGGARVHLHPV